MTTFLSFTGYNGDPILIDKAKIMALQEAPESTDAKPMTTVFMATIEGSEEWRVNETLAYVKGVIETLI